MNNAKEWFMTGIAYKYHALENETPTEFSERLMNTFNLNSMFDLEILISNKSKRDEVLVPGVAREDQLGKLHDVVKNLEL